MITVSYNFPLPTCQCGAMLGNGITGINIWGGGNTLNITVGSGNLWDHRGGMPWRPDQNFPAIRKALESQDMDAIFKMFAPNKCGNVRRPSLIPVGRVVITLPENALLLRYEQTLATGSVKVFYALDGAEKVMEFYGDMDMTDALAGKGLDESMSVAIYSAYELTAKANYKWLLSDNPNLKEHGFAAPVEFSGKNYAGFTQPMPNDPSYTLAYKILDNGEFTVTYKRGLENVQDAPEVRDFNAIAAGSVKFFTEYWQNVPEIKHQDAELDLIYYHGLFKYGIMTNPAGCPAGLQGPWIEDDRLPPWQGDYHFNINVQMCHLPGLKSGRFANLKKFFDMVLSWKEKLRYNAKCFVGLDNGYMLPHAVDDRAVCMGGFWTGTIDHACSAWVAGMMFDYCEYSCDMDYLKNEVYDFMLGVIRVYRAMMDQDENGKLCLPVTTSPEYRDTGANAWGKNASFQLAACRQLAKNILRAGEMLGVEADPVSTEINENLPLYSVQSAMTSVWEEKQDVIALWEGLALEESHRHHSHLAGICPFEVIDPLAPETEKLVQSSIEQWTILGLGLWTGWGVPWASQILSRCCNGGAATAMLKIWHDCFTNVGGGSLHDGRYKGISFFAQIRGEVMQMDGGMGAITAIQDQFMHVYDREIRVFYGIEQHIRNVSFKDMYAPGGMRVSGSVDEFGKVTVTVRATRDAELRLTVRRSERYTQKLNAGESVTLILKDGKLIRQ